MKAKDLIAVLEGMDPEREVFKSVPLSNGIGLLKVKGVNTSQVEGEDVTVIR